MPTCLHVAPHPDDEALGAPGTLLSLVDAGWQVANLACSLGHPDEVPRRRAEVTESCRRLGFELVLPARDVDPNAPGFEAHVAGAVAQLVAERPIELVVAPTPHDCHPAHEAVGRAVVRALRDASRPVRLWAWRVWGDLAHPTLLVPLRDEHLQRAQHGLAAHAGELARADYARVLTARAVVASVLDAERALGFGAAPGPMSYAEVLTEVFVHPGEPELRAGEPRELDPTDPLSPGRAGPVDLADLWARPSASAELRARAPRR